MSAESTARNRATLEEATNSAHFESTFFMSPLGGDGYGKTSRDIPSTIAPGKAAPALGAFEPAPRYRSCNRNQRSRRTATNAWCGACSWFHTECDFGLGLQQRIHNGKRHGYAAGLPGIGGMVCKCSAELSVTPSSGTVCFFEHAACSLTDFLMAQLPMIAGGNGMPMGYPTGGASSLSMMSNVAGGLNMRTNMQGSWMLSRPPNAPFHTSIPDLLPGGDQRLAINHMQRPGSAASIQQLQQLQNLQRLSALNQVLICLDARACVLSTYVL